MKTVYVLLFLLIAGSVAAQRHETGISGGGLLENSAGEVNNSNWNGGWMAGAYYKYSPVKWIGLQTGIYYKNVGRDLNTSKLTPRGSILFPLSAVVFSGFKFNLSGGIYIEHLTDNLRYVIGYLPETKTYIYDKIDKRPAWGYELSGKWNMKYCNLVFTFQKCFSSWMKDYQKVRWDFPLIKATPKSTTLYLSLEVPIRRFPHAKK